MIWLLIRLVGASRSSSKRAGVPGVHLACGWRVDATMFDTGLARWCRMLRTFDTGLEGRARTCKYVNFDTGLELCGRA